MAGKIKVGSRIYGHDHHAMARDGPPRELRRLRLGEFLALRRRHVDLAAGTVAVEDQMVSLDAGRRPFDRTQDRGRPTNTSAPPISFSTLSPSTPTSSVTTRTRSCSPPRVVTCFRLSRRCGYKSVEPSRFKVHATVFGFHPSITFGSSFLTETGRGR